MCWDMRALAKTMNKFLGSILLNSGVSLHWKYVQKKLQLNHISAIHHKLVMFEDEKNRVKTMSMQSSCLHSPFFLELP